MFPPKQGTQCVGFHQGGGLKELDIFTRAALFFCNYRGRKQTIPPNTHMRRRAVLTAMGPRFHVYWFADHGAALPHGRHRVSGSGEAVQAMQAPIWEFLVVPSRERRVDDLFTEHAPSVRSPFLFVWRGGAQKFHLHHACLAFKRCPCNWCTSVVPRLYLGCTSVVPRLYHKQLVYLGCQSCCDSMCCVSPQTFHTSAIE